MFPQKSRDSTTKDACFPAVEMNCTVAHPEPGLQSVANGNIAVNEGTHGCAGETSKFRGELDIGCKSNNTKIMYDPAIVAENESDD